MKLLRMQLLVLPFIFCVACVTERAEIVNKENISSSPQNTIIEQNTSNEIRLEGTVILHVDNPGTLSEVQYFILVSQDGRQIILFNEKGFSESFSQWVDKKIRVSGYESTGMIGFKRTEKTGLFVTSIAEAQ